jgi:hypothetical protein
MRPSRPLLALLALALTAVAGCSGDDVGGTPGDGSSPSAASSAAAVPDDWTETRVEGLTLAYPQEWAVRNDAEGVALQVGVPFTGQPFPPPQVQVYVEDTPVGTLQVREPITKAQIAQQLGITVPPSTPATVEGARQAVQFTYTYTTAGGTSTLDTPLEPTDMKQSDVLIDVPGLPKYGLRYSAPADQYDPAVWADLLASLRVGGGPDRGS